MSESHAKKGPAILGVAISTTVLALFCVLLRIYIRIRITRSFWWDDGLIVVAMALSIAGAVFKGLSIHNGAGTHTYDLADPLVQVPNVIKWTTAYQIDNVTCVNLTKLSILLFVLRIPNSKKWAYLIYFVMLSMSVVNIVTVFSIALQCRPLEKLWNPTIAGHCFYKGELSRYGYGQGVVNILTDFFCTITPILILWNVKIKRRLKFAICGLMSIGLLATASQIVRVIALNSLNAEDYTYQITIIAIAAILDQNLGIIAACVPTFQPLFRLLPQLLKSLRSKSSSKPRPTINSHYNNLDKTSSGNRSLEAGYGEQGSSYLRRAELANYSDPRDQYPLHYLT